MVMSSQRSAGAKGSTIHDAELRRQTPPSGSKKKVFLVDDHAVFLEGLTVLINGTAELVVCGESFTAEDALQKIPDAMPDLAIVDLTLANASGMELLKNLSLRYPSLPVLILSMHDEAVFAERTLKAGAKGYIMKHKAIREIKSAILRILGGGMYVSEEMTDRMLKSVIVTRKIASLSPLRVLSDRELEVFEMTGKGLGPSDISRALHLAVKTVETYRARIKEKLNAKDGLELRQLALNWVYGPRLPDDGLSLPRP
jgi:DNA-binding NarL/FixJ family response regulator